MSLAADQHARLRACQEFERPFVLVAGAGTGKTTTLVARIVTWLIGPGWEAHAADGVLPDAAAARVVDGLLAITFTKAAAAHMDQSVRAALREVEAGVLPRSVLLGGVARPPVPVECERARCLRLALDRPVATTIHAFCQMLLAEHPLEAEVAAGFEVDADEELLPEIARDAVEADLAAAFRGVDDEDWLTLARDGAGPSAVARCIAALRREGVRARELGADPLAPARLEAELAELARRVTAILDAGLAELQTNQRAPKSVEAAQAALELQLRLQARDPRDPSACYAARDGTALDGLLAKLGAWSKGEFAVTDAKVLGERCGAVSRAAAELRAPLKHYLAFDAAALAARHRLVLRILAATEERCGREGILSFGDLLERAGELLERHPEVVRRLRARYRQVLVDEFQDTDAVQCRLVRALCLGGSGTRPGLFLVGDPKQSIYGWRNADLAAYDAFVDEVLAAGGESGELEQNFRSSAAVLAAVRRFVAPVMHAEHGLQPRFQDLIHGSSAAESPVELWAAWTSDPAEPKRLHDTPVPVAAELEAATLAHALRAESAAGVRWKDMAILLRAKTALDPIQEALRGAGIPFQVEGDRSYYRRREIQDACALLGAIADPGDTLSLLAFLRSAACGVPDAALEPLWTGELPGLAAGLGAGADDAPSLERLRRLGTECERSLDAAPPPGGRRLGGFAAALDHALTALAELRRSLHADAPDVFVERVRTLLLLEPAEGARYLGSFRAANLERFFRQVAERLDLTGDPGELLRTLRRALDEQKESREARPEDTGTDAVRILTVHASKGLEFHSVFVPGIHRVGRRSTADADGYDRTTGEHRLLGHGSPGWWRVAEIAARREAAERVRLLYVALTRAKSRLVLSGRWPAQFAPRDPLACTTLLELLAHAAPAELPARLAAALSEGVDAFELDGFTVRLPVAAPVAPAAVETPASVERRVAAARADERALEALHAAARARSGCARVLPASAVPADDAVPQPVVAAPDADQALTRSDARVVGTLVHAALEELVRGAGADWREPRARVAAAAEGGAATAAQSRVALALLQQIEHGPLAARLAAILPHAVAAELDLCVAAANGEAALDAWVGSADLVYRDGETWVVADFKTGAIAPAADARAAAAVHSPQLDRYASALRTALCLDRHPRREVWFLREGRVEVLG